MIPIYEVFFNYLLKPTLLFWFKNKEAQFCLVWVLFGISIHKLSWVFRGKIDASLEINFWLPKSACLPRQLKTRIAFSMFPILDTNLWLFPRLSSGGKEINHVLTAQTKTEHWSLVEISARLFCFCPTALIMVNSHRRDDQIYWKVLARVLEKNLSDI